MATPDADTHCVDAAPAAAAVVLDAPVPTPAREHVDEKVEPAKCDDDARGKRHAADQTTLLADMGFRVVPTAESQPVIDWTAKRERHEEPAPARGSWGNDFVNGLGQRPQERGPNQAMSFKVRR